MEETAFVRYLDAKRTVDDRALNRRVWDAMISRAASPRVLELGAGIGTMVQRVIDDGRLKPSAWTLLDAQPGLIREARKRLEASASFHLDFSVADLDTYLDIHAAGGLERFDLIIANAFLDLFDPASILPRILPLAKPSGMFLFSITFDGLTALEPQVDADVDRRIIDLYHQTMDERIVNGRHSGDSNCGRHLLTLLPRCGYRIVEAGASDWVVHPTHGAYPADEQYFLSCILAFFEESLGSRRELPAGELDQWLSARRKQLADGELVFVAHQLDVLAASPG